MKSFRRMFSVLLVAVCIGVPSLCTAQQEAAKEEISVAGTRNLLAAKNGGRVVSFTSQLDDPGWHASNLIDGLVFDPKAAPASFGWASKLATFPQDIVFAFKDDMPHLIAKVAINTKTPDWVLLGRTAKDIEILVSTTTPDGPYESVATHSLLQGDPDFQTIAFKPVECKYLKLRILSNFGSDRYVSLGEVQAYEAIMGTGELDELISRLEQLLHDLKKYRDETQGKE